jgi:hypothetical protein
MPETPSEMEVLRASSGAAIANGLDVASDPFDTAAAVEADLAANAEARTELRRAADKAVFRQAAHDLADGLRGLIRVAPLVSVATAVGLGLLWGRRRTKRRPPPPRRA